MSVAVLFWCTVAMIVVIGFDGALDLRYSKQIKRLKEHVLIIEDENKAGQVKEVILSWVKRILMYSVLFQLSYTWGQQGGIW